MSGLPKAKAAPAPKFYPHGEHDVEHILQQIEAKRLDLTDSYADWVKIGFAIAAKYHEPGADLFHRVSALSPKYNPEACDRKYKQLCNSKHNQVTFASFMWLAKKEQQTEELVEAIYRAAKDAAVGMKIPAVPAPKPDKRKGKREVAVVQLSDWQLDPWLCNVIKYVQRHHRKNGKEDLEKALHYLEFALQNYDKIKQTYYDKP